VVGAELMVRAKRNDKGHLVPDASEEVIQKSQGFENYQLARREGTKASA
jgi:cytochrome c oxidase assembly protein subunit 11